MSVNQLPSKRPKCTNSSVWNRQTADLISCQQRLTFLCLQDTKHQLRKGTLLPPSAPLLSEEKASILEPWCATWNPRRWHRTVCASAHSAARSTFSRFISDDDVVPNCPRASCQLRPAACAPRLYNPNYVHSYRASFLCHSYQMSMAPFISHLKTGSSQPPRMSYPWVGAESEAECRAPSQISGHSPAPGQGPIPPGAERGRNLQTAASFVLRSAVIISRQLFSRGGRGRVYCKWLQKDSAVTACGESPAVRRRGAASQNVTVTLNYKMKSNLNVLPAPNHQPQEHK